MRVFISSVRRDLGAERDYLRDLLRAVGHEPSRFEDFGARNAPSRGACLEGVSQAEVYVLLLGPHYGDEMDDSGVAPTEEEYNVAQQRGIPILVFKKTGIDYDPAQAQFIRRLGDYQQGRFWAEFTDEKALGIAVTTALRNLSVPPAPPDIPSPHRVRHGSLADRSIVAHGAQHLCAGPGGPCPPDDYGAAATDVRAGRPRPTARRPRPGGGFFGEADALTVGSGSTTAWAFRQDGPRGGFYNERRADPYSGLSVGRDGSAMIFQALPTDNMGAIVNRADLGQRLGVLLRVLAPYLPSSEHVALAAALDPTDRLIEGDPNLFGNRNSAFMSPRGGAARAEPADQVSRASLSDGIAAVADELAVRLLQALRDANGARRPWG